MSGNHHNENHSNTLAGNINSATEVLVSKCYQCGKCSAGCPLADEMDYPPSLILRMLQTESPEMEEKVLRSYTIWLCLTCEMCIARCPMEIDIPKMMDFLRAKSLKLKMANPKAKNIISFHKSFLDSIQYTGRLFEMGLIIDYKTRSLNLLQDVLIAPTMFLKGKLAIIPELIKERKKMGRIFKKTLKK